MTVHFRSVLHAVPLFQDIESNIKPILVLSDTLDLVQDILLEENFVLESISDTIALEQTIDQSVKYFSINHTLHMEYQLSSQKILTRTTSHLLSFSSRAYRTYPQTVTQTITLSQLFHHHPLDVSVIPLGQSYSYSVSKPILDTIDLEQSILVNKIKNKTIAHSLALSSFAQIYKIDPKFYANPITPAPAPTYRHKITLSYGSTSLQLRDPEFGNALKYEQSRILRNNRGGEINIFKEGFWPESEIISYSFKALLQNDVWNLLYFMRLTLGHEVNLIDHEDQHWQGIITTPEKEVVEESRSGFSASFEFLGTRL